MRFKVLILLLTAILVSSCHEKGKYEFVKRFLENPEKIEEFLEKADFDAKRHIDNLKRNPGLIKKYIDWANKFIVINDKGEKELNWKISTYYDGYTTGSNKRIISITAEAKNGFSLSFSWYMYSDGTWRLNAIRGEDKPDKDESP
jgi:hypothetical protein